MWRMEQKLPVGVFSLEMTAESLVLRMLCSRSRVNLRNVREGFLAERDFPKLTGAAGKLASAPLFIDDSSGAVDSAVAGQGAAHGTAVRHQAFRG